MAPHLKKIAGLTPAEFDGFHLRKKFIGVRYNEIWLHILFTLYLFQTTADSLRFFFQFQVTGFSPRHSISG